MKETEMKQILLSIAIAISLSSISYAKDDGLTISTGKKGGTYFKTAKNLQNVFPEIVKVKKSVGSELNMKRLVHSDDVPKTDHVELAIVQLDHIPYYNETFEGKFRVLGELFNECIHFAVNPNKDVNQEDHLERKSTVIAIGKRGSGTAGSWNYATQLDKGYKNARVKFLGGVTALSQLALKSSDINAVLWVERPQPKPYSKMVKMAIKLGMKIVPFNDMEMNNTHEGLGRPIYNWGDVYTGKGIFGNSTVTSACTPAVLVARTDVDEDTLEELTEALVMYKSTIVPKL
jgi:TRAP-type uncharacterized transport system substrate-binding protein